MFYRFLITTLIFLMAQNSFARRGENDGGGNDDGAIIECSLPSTHEKILSFHSSAGNGEVTTGDLQLFVKSRGDEIAEMNITALNSGDHVRAKRLEELLKVTLTSDESSTPTIVESPTHKGFAQVTVIDSNSQDKAEVKSQSRRGQSLMQVIFTTDENSGQPINILCQKIR
ncbi:MAG: hypothetical protein KDD34_05255 [Bdellovibrionales bacterium]|nr:hypothetical protein [Bdellovibrionales bacterium]